MLKLDLRQQKKENSDIQTNLKSAQLDLKIANKEIKIKEEKLSDTKREVLDLQKQKVDKIESIKKLQNMLSSQESEEKKNQEI
jgi:hypothetical protein